MTLVEVLNYSGRVREYGGAVVRSAAVVFELADEAGAASIHRVDNTNSPPIASSSGPLNVPLLPPAPRQPPITSIPEVPPVPPLGGIYSPPSCTQGRVRVICGTLHARGMTTRRHHALCR